MKLSTFSSFLLFLTNGVNISPFSLNGKPNWNTSKCYQVFHFLLQCNAGECMQPSSGHHCGIFLVPDKMTAKENQAELFSGLYCCSFVTVSLRMCAGGLSVLQEYTWAMLTKMCLKFYPSNFNVQTCLMNKSSCPTRLMHRLYFGIKDSSSIDCLLEVSKDVYCNIMQEEGKIKSSVLTPWEISVAYSLFNLFCLELNQ